MTERAWYQDGGCVIGIVIMAFGLVSAYRQAERDRIPTVFPRLTGRVEQPFFGSPRLVITAWHQHTGLLRNGRLLISVKGVQVANHGGEDSEEYSFESWEPNHDHAVTLTFPLREVAADKEIAINYSLIADNIKPGRSSDAWVNGGWKSNPPSPP